MPKKINLFSFVGRMIKIKNVNVEVLIVGLGKTGYFIIDLLDGSAKQEILATQLDLR